MAPEGHRHRRRRRTGKGGKGVVFFVYTLATAVLAFDGDVFVRVVVVRSEFASGARGMPPAPPKRRSGLLLSPHLVVVVVVVGERA